MFQIHILSFPDVLKHIQCPWHKLFFDWHVRCTQLHPVSGFSGIVLVRCEFLHIYGLKFSLLHLDVLVYVLRAWKFQEWTVEESCDVALQLFVSCS